MTSSTGPLTTDVPNRPLNLAAMPRALTPLDAETLRPSVLIPEYNERNTIETILDRVHATRMKKEIVRVERRFDGWNATELGGASRGRLHRSLDSAAAERR